MKPKKGIIKQISSMFSFFINDLKTDVKAIKHIFKCVKEEKPILNDRMRQKMKDFKKEFTIGNYLKETWLYFLMFALFFVAGWWLSSQYYEGVCNSFIQNEIMPSVNQYLGKDTVSYNMTDVFNKMG